MCRMAPLRARPGPAGAEGARAKAEWRGLQGDVGEPRRRRRRAGPRPHRRGAPPGPGLRRAPQGRGGAIGAGLARSLRGSGKDMADKPHVRAFFDSAADGLEQLGTSIERRSLSDFYGEAEAIARRARWRWRWAPSWLACWPRASSSPRTFRRTRTSETASEPDHEPRFRPRQGATSSRA